MGVGSGAKFIMKISYIPNGYENLASSRLRVYKVATVLEKLGHTVRIKPAREVLFTDSDVVAVQKVNSDRAGRMMQRLMDNGVRVVWDVDDPIGVQMPCHVVTVGSRRLTQDYPDSIYIPDALDVSEGHPVKQTHSPELRRVCWFGLHCNLYNCRPVYEACQELGMSLCVITNIGHKDFTPLFPLADYVAWSLETVDQNIVDCDLVVLPYLLDATPTGWLPDGQTLADWNNAKGENRLLKAWALGMPVIGAPIQSYMECGLFDTAVKTQDWVAKLRRFRAVELRQGRAAAGRMRAARRNDKVIAKQWLEVFRG